MSLRIRGRSKRRKMKKKLFINPVRFKVNQHLTYWHTDPSSYKLQFSASNWQNINIQMYVRYDDIATAHKKPGKGTGTNQRAMWQSTKTGTFGAVLEEDGIKEKDSINSRAMCSVSVRSRRKMETVSFKWGGRRRPSNARHTKLHSCGSSKLPRIAARTGRSEGRLRHYLPGT